MRAGAALRGADEGVPALPPGRWRPSPAVRASFVLHGLGALVLLVDVTLWPWVLGVLAADHAFLSFAVLFPRSGIVGANVVRLPAAAQARHEVALTFDDGPEPEITPKVMDMLEARGMRASFFCIGERASAHPELVREIARRGHHVENHSDRHHPGFSFFGYGRSAREVDAAQRLLAGLAGRAPRFFRAPAGFRNPFLDPVLARRGLRYVSWTRRGFDAVESNPARVLQRLTEGLAAGDILLLHDGTRARTVQGEPVVLAVLPGLLDALRDHDLMSVPLGTALPDEPSERRD